MTKDKKEQAQEKSKTTPPAATPDELNDEKLDKVSGGVLRRGGDDDLDDLEVER
jgi:hypothetical protein